MPPYNYQFLYHIHKESEEMARQVQNGYSPRCAPQFMAIVRHLLYKTERSLQKYKNSYMNHLI